MTVQMESVTILKTELENIQVFLLVMQIAQLQLKKLGIVLVEIVLTQVTDQANTIARVGV